MNPENRRLIRITPDEAAATSEMFDLLLGDNLAGRKEYIAENGADYLELADISYGQKWGIATCGFGKWTACGRLRRWPW